MKRRHLFQLPCVLAALWFVSAVNVNATETDQFTLPPQPLADIGQELETIVRDRLQRIMDDINQKLHDPRRDQRATADMEPGASRPQAFTDLTARGHLARQIYNALGEGFKDTRIEGIIYETKFAAQPALFAPSFKNSIFASTGLLRPLNHIGVCPTAKVHGVEMGIDKIGHIFQQGHEYLEVYERARREGADQKEARRKAVKLGVSQENGVYGVIPSGAYSNADLASNYAGLLLYLNLTESVTINGAARPPLLLCDESGWRFNPAAGPDILRPFISEHFNEAMNPSEYDWAIRGSVKKQVRKRCQAWIECHQCTREAEEQRLERLSTFHGEDYGHGGMEDLITLVNAGFDEMEKAAKRTSKSR